MNRKKELLERADKGQRVDVFCYLGQGGHPATLFFSGNIVCIDEDSMQIQKEYTTVVVDFRFSEIVFFDISENHVYITLIVKKEK